ncbi:glycine, alanine and asparagine-rich protein-like [Anopheles ziemanni]|uniref:glycine, alanine and asparagine-rich protein-like n=1 Tax=Anopheles coustani TaxID=139045 RepID=UPI0026598280|nr:glycine, alanine and asparagine-rich protein-like [Anopheles coustani]XP_058177915.1 glycine, alanine and asparagine-rich protein-like [Anopheles ziemanni]
MRTVYTVFFLVAASFFAGIVIAGVFHIHKRQTQASVLVEPEIAVRSKRQIVQILRGFSGSSASAAANTISQNSGGVGGFSGSNAAANSLSQNIGGFGFSGSNANANAFGQSFGPGGFGSSAANAQAQSFQSDGPLGSFGASASNAASQGFNAGPGGLSGSAGFSGSQAYKLPGNRQISLSYSNGFSLANGQPALSNGFSVSES